MSSAECPLTVLETLLEASKVSATSDVSSPSPKRQRIGDEYPLGAQSLDHCIHANLLFSCLQCEPTIGELEDAYVPETPPMGPMPATIIIATPPKRPASPPPPPAIRRYKTKAAIAMGPTARYEPKMDAAVRSRIKILEMKIADLKGDLAWYDEDKIDRETRIADLLAALSQSQAEGVVFSARIQKARDALLEYDL